jgi:hypothetical protein
MSNGALPPRVWVLKGPKAGDFAQMSALAAALGWPFEVRSLAFRRWELALHAIPRPSLAAVDRGRSDRLTPPWPDLVLTAGRRNELPARWIRAQAGGVTRLVHVGRPWSAPSQFDLVVSNRQYALEPSARVLVNDLPLVDVDPKRLDAAPLAWRDAFAAYPRPWTAVLVGGSSGPLVMTPARGAVLGARLERFTARTGGSVFVTDSPRTPAGVVDAIAGELRVPAFVHRFSRGAENPYFAFLATADAFVVTADSVSMLAEAMTTGRPVFVFDFLSERGALGQLTAWRWRPLVHRLSHAMGPRRMRRDVHALHRALVDGGRVRWFDDGATPFTPATAPNDDLARTLARVRALFDG